MLERECVMSIFEKGLLVLFITNAVLSSMDGNIPAVIGWFLASVYFYLLVGTKAKWKEKK
jgi:hypothetical protein